MEQLDFLTNEQLLQFFHCKKTEMSCIEQPHTFLNQLRDHNLIPEDKYQKVIRSTTKHTREKRMYELLDWFETKRPEFINLFWKCVFKDHILQQYVVLRLLRNNLLDGSFSFEKLPEKELTPEDPKKSTEAVGKPKMQKGAREKEGKTMDKGEKEQEAAKKRPCNEASNDREQPCTSSQLTPIRKRRSSKPIFRSPIMSDEDEEIWNWPIYRTHLPVVCGGKSGILHREKLARGEMCIQVKKRWFSPKDFEEFGGKKNCKNWKTSIYCGKTTLRSLIQEGHLKCPNLKRHRRGTSPSHLERRCLFDSSQSEDSIADSEEEEGQQQSPEENNVAEAAVAESSDETDLSAFKGDCLSVTCGSARGTLYKNRFASGCCGKCIRTEDKWLTPENFLKEDPTLKKSHWMNSIHCQDTPLSFLIEKRILQFHSVHCKCTLCSREPQHLKEQENDDECFICSQEGKLICCDTCPRSFHCQCHLPFLDENILGDRWMCTYCVLNQSLEWRYSTQMDFQAALQKNISDFTLHCQYLLLCLYKADKQRVFVLDPHLAVASYSNFIKCPMWLDKVCENLDNCYSTVGEFYSDILKIFDNCAEFNKDNDFGKTGAELRNLFEEEFLRIFNINITEY